eukprot:c8415_g1_i4.p1 GENE.c8415_g1_i4~~c8415_g1_i4.p1  ORF type:complete len:116 (+),score=18.85 c8415_g1_i4:550-897(+)
MQGEEEPPAWFAAYKAEQAAYMAKQAEAQKERDEAQKERDEIQDARHNELLQRLERLEPPMQPVGLLFVLFCFFLLSRTHTHTHIVQPHSPTLLPVSTQLASRCRCLVCSDCCYR